MNDKKQILILGSTNRKLATFQNNKLISLSKGPCNEEDLRCIEMDSKAKTLVISVRPDLNNSVSKIPNTVILDKLKAAEIYNLRGFYREFGVDRMANLIGALRNSPKQSLAVLDFGTCTTLSVLKWIEARNSYDYYYGYLSPGLSTTFSSVHSATKSLPLASELEFVEYSLIWKPGTKPFSARDAIFEGIIQQSLMQIELAQQKCDELGNDTKLFLTGGWSNTLLAFLSKTKPSIKPITEANLALWGGFHFMKESELIRT